MTSDSSGSVETHGTIANRERNAVMEVLISLLLGIGLSAAAGFRVFLPPLVLSVAGLYFGAPLPEQLSWLATDTAFLILLTATLLEIGAYYVPWLDNLLDALATPSSIAAGTAMTGLLLGGAGEMNPILQWSIALIAGGGTAATVQTATNALRLTSSVATGGLANPILATIENVMALITAVLAVLFPLPGGAGFSAGQMGPCLGNPPTADGHRAGLRLVLRKPGSR
jgi:hypothetical protein